MTTKNFTAVAAHTEDGKHILIGGAALLGYKGGKIVLKRQMDGFNPAIMLIRVSVVAEPSIPERTIVTFTDKIALNEGERKKQVSFLLSDTEIETVDIL